MFCCLVYFATRCIFKRCYVPLNFCEFLVNPICERHSLLEDLFLKQLYRLVCSETIRRCHPQMFHVSKTKAVVFILSSFSQIFRAFTKHELAKSSPPRYRHCTINV